MPGAACCWETTVLLALLWYHQLPQSSTMRAVHPASLFPCHCGLPMLSDKCISAHHQQTAYLYLCSLHTEECGGQSMHPEAEAEQVFFAVEWLSTCRTRNTNRNTHAMSTLGAHEILHCFQHQGCRCCTWLSHICRATAGGWRPHGT